MGESQYPPQLWSSDLRNFAVSVQAQTSPCRYAREQISGPGAREAGVRMRSAWVGPPLSSTPVGWRECNHSGCLTNLAAHPRGGTVSGRGRKGLRNHSQNSSAAPRPCVCEWRSGPVSVPGRGLPCTQVPPQPVFFWALPLPGAHRQRLARSLPRRYGSPFVSWP